MTVILIPIHTRQYMSAIFYHDKEQHRIAEQSMKEAQKNCTKQITTLILPVGQFYDAEE